jgi:hypothetical protein
MPSVGVPALPWMWAKARSERGALIRLCGDGMVSNEARSGVIQHTRKSTPSQHTETDRADSPRNDNSYYISVYGRFHNNNNNTIVVSLFL